MKPFKTEKDTSTILMQQYGLASNFEHRDIIQLIRFQFWLTSGMIIKAVNEDYSWSSMSVAISATTMLCDVAEPHIELPKDQKDFFQKTRKELNNKLIKFTDRQNEKDNADAIIYCQGVLRFVNKSLAEINGGEEIEKQKSVEI